MIKFITQTRLVQAATGKELEPWEDCCKGHTDFNQAMVCHARSLEVDEGKCEEGEMMGALLNMQTAHFRKMGWRCESRLIKRTTQEEIIDA